MNPPKQAMKLSSEVIAKPIAAVAYKITTEVTILLFVDGSSTSFEVTSFLRAASREVRHWNTDIGIET